MELPLFEEVADAVRGLVGGDLGAGLHCRPRRYGIKVWFDAAEPTREHYEAQVISSSLVRGARALALEIGFHAEHRDVASNDAVLWRLIADEAVWRTELGAAAEAGPFLGRADDWRRISETWADPDLSAPDLPFEVAARLADYVLALEPVLRAVRS